MIKISPPYLILLCVLSLLYGCGIHTKRPTKLELIALSSDIPGIRSESDTSAHSISSLFPYKDKLYIGYGDGSRGGGMEESVNILYYDIALDSFFAPFKTSSRVTKEFLPFQDHLFVPNRDPVGHYGGLFRLNENSGAWDSTSYVPGALHVFGVHKFDNKLFVCSSGFDTSLVASSDDLGDTWEIEHLTKLNLIDSSSFSYGRYYFIDGTKDFLYTMSMKHFYDIKTQKRIRSETLVYKLQNDNWTQINVEKDWFYSPIILNDSLVSFTYPIGSNEKSHKTFAALKNDSLVHIDDFLPNGWGMKSFFIERKANGEDQLWALMDSNDSSTLIVTTKDFKDWSTTHYISKDNLKSIAVYENKIYLGSSDGELYQCTK